MDSAFLVLHAGHPFTWKAWHPEPVLVGTVAAATAFYCVRLTSRDVDFPGWLRIGSFFTGIFFVILALASPIDVGGGQSFALHMLQHIILSTWAPPLLLLGMTAAILRPLLDLPGVLSLLRPITHPFVGAPLFIANMWFWHIPPIYDIAVADGVVHYAMHLSFLISGLLFWWTLAAPIKDLHSLSTGWRLFYIFITGFPMMALAFALIATPNAIYDYYATQPRLWGMSPETDQQIGGALMGTLGELTMIIPFTMLFVRLMSDEEQQEQFNGPIGSGGASPDSNHPNDRGKVGDRPELSP